MVDPDTCIREGFVYKGLVRDVLSCLGMGPGNLSRMSDPLMSSAEQRQVFCA
jgi:hypothetical protein